jgi:hypothetical protein
MKNAISRAWITPTIFSLVPGHCWGWTLVENNTAIVDVL